MPLDLCNSAKNWIHYCLFSKISIPFYPYYVNTFHSFLTFPDEMQY